MPTRRCRAGCPGLGCVPGPLPTPNSAGLPSCRAPPGTSTLLTSGCPQHGAAVALPSPQEPGAEPTCSHHQRLCYKQLRAMGKEVPCTPNPTRTAVRIWSSRLHSLGRGRLGETPRGEGRGPHFVPLDSSFNGPLPENGGDQLSRAEAQTSERVACPQAPRLESDSNWKINHVNRARPGLDSASQPWPGVPEQHPNLHLGLGVCGGSRVGHLVARPKSRRN